MDLKSAYDSVWIDALIYKLVKIYKFDGNFIAWISHYFNNRYNRVRLGNTLSNWHKALPNLPQGDTFCPILFCLFLNDYNGKNNNIEFSNFADDCTLEMTAKEQKCKLTNKMKFDLRSELQSEMNHFYQYTLNNKLVLKKIKCNTVTFCNKKNFKAYVYNIDGNKLELIHSIDHAPQKCKHSEKYCYQNGLNYNDCEDSNGDSDLEFLNPSDGNKYNSNNNNNNNNNNFTHNSFSLLISKFTEKDRNKQNEFEKLHKFSNVVRILGVHFDSKLSFKSHIEKALKKIKMEINKLKRIAYSIHYPISSPIFWKLWIANIKPKVEYALCTISSVISIDELERVQMKVAKLALNMKNICPSLYLKDLMDIKSFKNRLEELQVKLWHKYYRAPPYLMQYHTFEKWKSYIEYNGGNIEVRETRANKHINIDNFNINKFKFIIKSPLSRAYKLIRKITPSNHTVFKKKTKQVMRPPPVYSSPFPSNCIYYKNYNNTLELDKIIVSEYNNFIVFFSDGSCKPNPGPGGSAYYARNFSLKEKYCPLNHDTTINFAELNSIKMIFNDMIDYVIERSEVNKWYNNNMVIFSDSAFTCNLFNGTTYPKFDYLYRLMDECVNYLNILDNYNIKIYFGKIRSHRGIEGNQIADKLANRAADIAVSWKKENNYNFNTSLNPLSVDISYSLKKLYKIHEKERKLEWINFRNNVIEEKNLELDLRDSNDRKLSKMFINSEFLFMQAMFDENDCVRNVRNIFKAEMFGLRLVAK